MCLWHTVKITNIWVIGIQEWHDNTKGVEITERNDRTLFS